MLPINQSKVFAAGVLTTALVTAMPAFSGDETKEAWRLFVTDQAEGQVTVVDPIKTEILTRFATKGYVSHAKLSESGNLFIAVQADHDTVQFFETGVSISSHGEHEDINVKDPAPLPVVIEGARPIHAVMHHDKIVQFFDRDGEARVYDEEALLQGDTQHKVIKTTAPHHGVVVPMGKHFVMSEPNLEVDVAEGKLPPRLGAKVVDDHGHQIGEIATCTGLHGEAASADLVAFGCDEGVLFARADKSGVPQLELVKYAEDMPKGRVATLAGSKSTQFFLGDYGPDRLVLIDPSQDMPYRVIDLHVRDVHFVLDPIRLNLAYVFTEDGKLHALDVLKGEIVRSAKITAPYSKDGHWRDPRPRIAVMGDMIALTDPRESLLRLLDVKTFEENDTIAIEGLPFNVVAVGGTGLEH